MPANFTTNDVVEILTKQFGLEVEFGGGQTRGIGLAYPIDRDHPENRHIGYISQFQQEQYENTSADPVECAVRIRDHIVNGRRSDIDMRTQAMLDEQARQFQAKLDAVMARLDQKEAAAAAPALPPSATEIPVVPKMESEIVTTQEPYVAKAVEPEKPLKVKKPRAPRGTIKHAERLSTDLVLAWAKDVGFEVKPDHYDSKQLLLGWVVAKVKRMHEHAFGKHPLRPDTQERQDYANQKAGIPVTA